MAQPSQPCPAQPVGVLPGSSMTRAACTGPLPTGMHPLACTHWRAASQVDFLDLHDTLTTLITHGKADLVPPGLLDPQLRQQVRGWAACLRGCMGDGGVCEGGGESRVGCVCESGASEPTSGR